MFNIKAPMPPSPPSLGKTRHYIIFAFGNLSYTSKSPFPIPLRKQNNTYCLHLDVSWLFSKGLSHSHLLPYLEMLQISTATLDLYCIALILECSFTKFQITIISIIFTITILLLLLVVVVVVVVVVFILYL